jgi:GTP-binding protein
MVDVVKLIVQAGNGGDGRVSFRRLKFLPKGGPDGGDGGDGGSVWLVGDQDLNTLRKFSGSKLYAAQNGGQGGKNNMHGANGDDLEITVPVGTVVSGGAKPLEILTDGERVRIARGGHGGKGNDFFKNSVNQAPMKAQPGEPGEHFELTLELKLLANLGLVGFPNVGKSTLLSVLTNAHPEIANYPFTTIEPNLGVLADPITKKSLVIADIPGLIEGASEGKGLGHQFLRHLERCTVLLFVLALDDAIIFQTDLSDAKKAAKIGEQFAVLLRELTAFSPDLAKKRKIIGVNKIDVYPPALLKTVEREAKKLGDEVALFSGVTQKGIPELKKRLLELLK